MAALVDFVIGLTVLEAVVLTWRRRRTGRGPEPSRLLPNLASGLCLLIGLRLALAGLGGVWIAACLAGSGVAHVLDMRAR
jgi:hypothetical protein